jgi:hypothetical protein
VSSFLDQARSRALRPVAGLPRPRLTVVARAATRAPRIPFVALVVTLLVGGLIGLLLLNTALQRGAYTVTGLRDRAAALDDRLQELQVKVDALSEPQRLARQAQRLGMVADGSPGYIRLSTGAVIGHPVAGRPGNAVDVGGRAVSPTHRGKEFPPLAGTGASLTSGPVVVAAAKHGHRPTDGRQGHRGRVDYGGEAQGPAR